MPRLFGDVIAELSTVMKDANDPSKQSLEALTDGERRLNALCGELQRHMQHKKIEARRQARLAQPPAPPPAMPPATTPNRPDVVTAIPFDDEDDDGKN